MIRKFWGWSSQRASSLLIIVAIIGGGAYAIQMHDLQKRQSCFSSYLRAYAAQSTVRSDLNKASDDSKTVLLTGIASAFLTKPSTDKAEQAKRTAAFLMLLSDYKAAAAGVSADRDAHPLPNLRSC